MHHDNRKLNELFYVLASEVGNVLCNEVKQGKIMG